MVIMLSELAWEEVNGIPAEDAASRQGVDHVRRKCIIFQQQIHQIHLLNH